jgi:DNA-binding CsgD family transcriptional regulator
LHPLNLEKNLDRVLNPFAPGAGSRPPELAGRDPIIESATVALKRVSIGRHAKSQMLLGLRGVGKTVLLNRISEIAEDLEYLPLILEAPEGRRLAELLAPPLRVLLFRLSGVEKARVMANRAMATLRSFAGVFKVSFGDLEIGVDPEPNQAASGDLEADLPNLLLVVAQAAKQAERPVAIFIDEVQYLPAVDLSALIGALHRVGQKGLPLVVFGAGLPQIAGLAGEAKSYAERLFDFPPIGPLGEEASKQAVREPIRDAGAEITSEALDRIYQQTEGYPYFLQEWGHHCWDLAAESPIGLADVDRATVAATAALDASFFRVRFDRLTPREQDYLRAMAEMGRGPHRSGEIAARLEIDVTTAGSLRTGLIRKGMIYAPSHGETAFTVPMFDDYMRRAIPSWTAPVPGKKKKR